MKLLLSRKYHTEHSTIGMLDIDDQFECYTLEDKTRRDKIPGQTAIPTGTYSVVIDWSNRFQREMPHVLAVPGFEGIRIHAGNTDKDTEGCILVGTSYTQDFIGNSKIAFEKLYEKLKGSKTDITLEVREL